ncbi:hypothetical protein [Streptomyces sp. CBMA156]|uniref:hypothetical protein n=1 Tax=Streptomyces sp. CBMA156 TaxID=1930280 RepID=UPI001661A74F|nr:hypothetical protein [Streptomyces sp. CBMA156]MBD0673027.1 hypothetical protein [Streptomyces sp. CBMA156]
MPDTGRPLLFLDVDGPLIPFGDPPPGGYPTHRSPYVPTGAVPGGNPLVTRVDPELGSRLLGLPAEPVWATTWLEDANECLAPWLGLPRLPVVDWPVDAEDGPGGVHWKTRTLVEWAGGRPFAWVDDEITGADRRWVAAHSPTRALLHRVDPRRGLGDADFTALDAWLRAL